MDSTPASTAEALYESGGSGDTSNDSEEPSCCDAGINDSAKAVVVVSVVVESTNVGFFVLVAHRPGLQPNRPPPLIPSTTDQSVVACVVRGHMK
jgi:hypothetical protein